MRIRRKRNTLTNEEIDLLVAIHTDTVNSYNAVARYGERVEALQSDNTQIRFTLIERLTELRDEIRRTSPEPNPDQDYTVTVWAQSEEYTQTRKFIVRHGQAFDNQFIYPGDPAADHWVIRPELKDKLLWFIAIDGIPWQFPLGPMGLWSAYTFKRGDKTYTFKVLFK